MPTTFLLIGMAGTGKSTFTARLNSWLSSLTDITLDRYTGLNKDITLINLDPAILKTKVPLDIDIREHFDIENIMRDYDLGPNGSVTTILNLFMLKWDGKISSKYSVIDTPGQIEAFVWSNGGKILVHKIIKENNYQNTEHSSFENEEIEQITKDIGKTSLGTKRSVEMNTSPQACPTAYEDKMEKCYSKKSVENTDQDSKSKPLKNKNMDECTEHNGTIGDMVNKSAIDPSEHSDTVESLKNQNMGKCTEHNGTIGDVGEKDTNYLKQYKEQDIKHSSTDTQESNRCFNQTQLKNEKFTFQEQTNFTNISSSPKEKATSTNKRVDKMNQDGFKEGSCKTELKERKGQLIILYMLDSKDCSKPCVFMCNMLYALIIKMRFNIPIVLIFNKIDLAPVPINWLKDYETFLEDIDQESMNSSLLSSMALHFEEYYNKFEYVGVSAETGQGKKDFFDCMEKITGLKYQK